MGKLTIAFNCLCAYASTLDITCSAVCIFSFTRIFISSYYSMFVHHRWLLEEEDQNVRLYDERGKVIFNGFGINLKAAMYPFA